MDDETLLRRAIALARQAREAGGDPFGAVLALHGEIVHEATDRSFELYDPTYHAELSAISEYCRLNRRMSLAGYSLYASTEPCPMCAGAIHWARISRVVFSVTQAMWQGITGGRLKPACVDLINMGRTRAEVIGPLLPEEGLAVFAGYQYISKVDRPRLT